jgi:hypothetical protein
MALPVIFWLASTAGCIGGIVNECILDGGGLVTARISSTINALGAISTFLSNGTSSGMLTAHVSSLAANFEQD